MYKLYSNKKDSVYIGLASLEKYIGNYIKNSSYDFKNISIEFFLNENDNNEIIIFINEKISKEILNKIESLRREIIFFFTTELDINDFYVNIVLR